MGGAHKAETISKSTKTSAGAIRRKEWCRSRSGSRKKEATKSSEAALIAPTRKLISTNPGSINTSTDAKFKQVKAPFDGTSTERQDRYGKPVTGRQRLDRRRLWIAWHRPIPCEFRRCAAGAPRGIDDAGAPAELRAKPARWAVCSREK